MVQIEPLRLLILGINDKRVNGNVGPAGTFYGVPQQGSSEFEAVIGESNRKAPHSRDGNRRITWQTLGKPGWDLAEENPARS